MTERFNHPDLITAFDENTQVFNEPSDDSFIVTDVSFDTLNTADNIDLKYLIHTEIKSRYREYRSFNAYSKLMDNEELEQEQKLIKMAKEGKELPPVIYGKRFLSTDTLDKFMEIVGIEMENQGMKLISGELGPAPHSSSKDYGSIAAELSATLSTRPKPKAIYKWPYILAGFVSILSVIGIIYGVKYLIS